MNNEYYKQVLEDVQSDLADVEQTVSELHGIERYVQRKMEADTGNGESKLSYDQYQALLDDVRQDVDEARSKIGELRGVGNFAREKLKAAGVEVGDPKTEGKAASPPPEKPKPKPTPPKANTGESTEEEKSPVPSDQTVEFGPNGFPMTK